MLKEFFLVDYNTISFLKEISNPLSEIVIQSFLMIAALFEVFRGMIGKSNLESRITLFLLSAVSIAVFTQYNQQVLDISFEVSDKILSKIHVNSMESISNVVKSTPSKQTISSNKNPKESDSTNSVLGEAKSFMADNLAVAIAWLISVIAIGLSRVLFSVIYYALIVLSPIIVFISIFPGFESSLKAFWQTFLWCFLAPIVFSVIFVLMHIVAQKEGGGLGIEQLISVLLYGIFLVGSFIITYKITSSQAISGFAEHASMIGAMTMAAPFTATSSFAQSAIHSPLKTLNNAKQSIGLTKNALQKISSKSSFPHGGVRDVSKMTNQEIQQKLGKKTADGLSHQLASSNYHGNKLGISSNAFHSFNQTPHSDAQVAIRSQASTLNQSNSIQSLKGQRLMGVSNFGPNFNNQKPQSSPASMPELRDSKPKTTTLNQDHFN